MTDHDDAGRPRQPAAQVDAGGLGPRRPRDDPGRRAARRMVASARISQPGLPVIVPVTEFRDIFGVALTNMLDGADPAAEMKRATAEFQPVLDKSQRA